MVSQEQVKQPMLVFHRKLSRADSLAANLNALPDFPATG